MVHAVPAGTESARPFLPALDYATSKAFYEALGFAKELDGDDVAIYRIGSTSFLLQRYYQKEWAENFMMQLLVDDLDAWWGHIVSLDLPTTYGVPAPKPPTMQPWGLRIAYVGRSVGGALARGSAPAGSRARPLAFVATGRATTSTVAQRHRRYVHRRLQPRARHARCWRAPVDERISAARSAQPGLVREWVTCCVVCRRSARLLLMRHTFLS